MGLKPFAEIKSIFDKQDRIVFEETQHEFPQ